MVMRVSMNYIACIFSLTCAVLLHDPMIPGPIFAADSMPRVSSSIVWP
jgi:hypothetical protein